MARDKISLQLPTLDTSSSVGTKTITKQAVTQANGIEIQKALACKDNSLVVIIENTATSDKTVTFKAGDYPNAILGDCNVVVSASSVAQVTLHDPSRFERKDGSVYVDFASGFTGNIYALGKRAGLAPVS